MKRALLVIDVQNVYFSGKLSVKYPENSLSRILEAIRAAASARVPVIIVQHSSSSMANFQKGSHEWQLHPEIAKCKYELLIEKEMPGSFTKTKLQEWLGNNGIDTLAICGYMTQMCCDTTARQACELGFSVEFLCDATGTPDISNYAGTVSAKQLHDAILVTQAMRFSKVLTTQQWLADIQSNNEP